MGAARGVSEREGDRRRGHRRVWPLLPKRGREGRPTKGRGRAAKLKECDASCRKILHIYINICVLEGEREGMEGESSHAGTALRVQRKDSYTHICAYI